MYREHSMHRKKGKQAIALILAVILLLSPCNQINAETEETIEMDIASEESTESESEVNTDIETEASTESEDKANTDVETEENTENKSEFDTDIVPEEDTECADETDTDAETDDEEADDIEYAETEEQTEQQTADEKSDNQISLEEIRERVEERFLEDGYAVSGNIDSGFSAERVTGNSVMQLSGENPVRYSAVEEGKVSAVRNQGNWNDCWAFAAVCTAESGYKALYGHEADLSESHFINFFYNSELSCQDGNIDGDAVIPLVADKVNNGGNAAFSTFALARWTGVADEAYDSSFAYMPEYTYEGTQIDISSEYAYTDAVHLQNAYWISSGDRTAVKNAIVDYGAVAMGYKYNKYRDSEYVDELIGEYTGPAVYYNEQANLGSGHAVAIVGWDDEFDRENFLYTFDNQENIQLGVSTKLPQNNGAWLVKNSWGSEYGDDGYFWISYEDASLSDTMYAFEYEKADNYNHIYQYDGSVGTRYVSAETITAAAVYQSNGSQLLEAVGVGIASAETDYTVEIYTKLSNANDPQSGQLASSVSGTTTFQGYHTIKLDEAALIADGDLFGIVITLTNGKVEGQNTSAIFMDQSYDNGTAVRFVAKANPGETFIKNGNQWGDAYESGTFRIKAYTSDFEFDVPEENITLIPAMMQEIDEQEYNGTKNEPDITITYMGEQLIQDVDYSVEYVNNDHAADKADENAPKAIITGIGKYTGTVEQSFTILPKEITEDMVDSTALTYNGAVQEDLRIFNGDTQLAKGTDYTISYNKQPCNVGAYQTNVTGKGNYTGTLQFTVSIGRTTLTEDMIILENTAVYTGKAIKPQIKAYVNGVELPAASFSVSYKNNTNVGTATVTVTGKGGCQGKVQKTFEIFSKEINAEASVTVAKSTYTGKALTPAVTVKCEGRTLKKGKDYTVAYENNIMTGENAVLTIKGAGNYNGTVQQNFAILPKEISSGSVKTELGFGECGSVVRVLCGKAELTAAEYSAVVYKAGTKTAVDLTQLELGGKYDVEVMLKGNYRIKNGSSALKKNIVCKKSVEDLNIALENSAAAYIYNGKAQKPKLTVREQSGAEVSKSNYTVSYLNNINAGTATAVVTGKGAYAGTKAVDFTIQKQQLNNLTIAQIKDQTYTQKMICPAVKVKNGSKTLKCGEGKDYVCMYGSNVDVSYVNGNVIAGAYADIHLSDNYEVPEGTSTRIYFKIMPAKLSAVTLSKAYYTKQAVLPDEIVVKAGKLEVPKDCYTVTADNNTAVSSRAVLTATAAQQSNYTGSLSKKYSIVKQELKTLVLPEIPDMPYLGQPVDVSSYALMQQNGEPVDSSQYVVSVKNNTKPGKATVTYKAAGDSLYKGSVSVKFNIVKATIAQAIDYEASQTIEKPYTGEAVTLTEKEVKQLAPIKGFSGTGNPPYIVSYAKNINAGRAAVILTGKDYLQGSVTLYFTITPKSIFGLKISTGEKQLDYNDGTPVYLELKEVTDGTQSLRPGKDYTYSYTNADRKGTACLTVTGIGNYTGTRRIYYQIV